LRDEILLCAFFKWDADAEPSWRWSDSVKL
jgi:hypothetical protein